MLPKITKFNVLDDMFDEPFFTKKSNEIMKTDIKEGKDNYVLEVDMPGFNKDNIKIELEDGYVNITASIDSEETKKDEEEKYIHRERFYGKCSRSYFVGENIDENDIKASFKNGILSLTFPKNKEKEEVDKKYITISE